MNPTKACIKDISIYKYQYGCLGLNISFHDEYLYKIVSKQHQSSLTLISGQFHREFNCNNRKSLEDITNLLEKIKVYLKMKKAPKTDFQKLEDAFAQIKKPQALSRKAKEYNESTKLFVTAIIDRGRNFQISCAPVTYRGT